MSEKLAIGAVALLALAGVARKRGSRAKEFMDGTAVIVYHGTLAGHLPSILEKGIEPTPGWGGYGQEGVSLALDHAVAMYWARIAAIGAYQEDGFDLRLDEKNYASLPSLYQCAVVLTIRVPASRLHLMQADLDQMEDFNLTLRIEDWQESAEVIGSVVYPSTVPPSWIVAGVARKHASGSSNEEFTVVRLEVRQVGFAGHQIIESMGRGRIHDPHRVKTVMVTLAHDSVDALLTQDARLAAIKAARRHLPGASHASRVSGVYRGQIRYEVE